MCIKCNVIRKYVRNREINRAGEGMISAGYGSKGSSIKRSINKIF